ncbi:MAG: murein biosynthesis integral membrane protein MurJ [Actinobacteria bacterium]|nr:murein biosynthesis integral membrane protein MurJ [Actinomycetota bacterium]
MASLAEPQGSLARGAAIITVATALSRITGFVRVMVVAAAMGTTFLANTYQTANTAPNVVFELVAAGVLTSVFVPTFVDYLVKGRQDEGWQAANALTTVAVVGLVAIALLVALLGEPLMRLLTLGVADADLRAQEISLGASFMRLFAPQIVFYGAGMIMTGALHAHRKFAIAAIAPIFNNLVVIGVYVLYATLRGNDPPTVDGITTLQTLVLGLGTTLGVVAMTVCLIPQLRSLGWHFRFKWAPRHPAVRKAAHLGVWALGYAGGYQAGLIVVLLLANSVEGGVAAYQWAFTFFYMPHALFAVAIFHVLFPAMSESAARGEPEELLIRLRDGLRMLAFILLPTAAVMLAGASAISNLTLEYGVMTESGAELVARVLAAFVIGLPTYSTFLVVTRAYYALSDTKTPALVNGGAVVISSALGVALFTTVDGDWSVPTLALAHSAAFAVAAVVLLHLLSRRLGTVATRDLKVSVGRSFGASLLSLAIAGAVTIALPASTKLETLVNFLVAAGAGLGAYVVVMVMTGAPELRRFIALVGRSESR